MYKISRRKTISPIDDNLTGAYLSTMKIFTEKNARFYEIFEIFKEDN